MSLFLGANPKFTHVDAIPHVNNMENTSRGIIIKKYFTVCFALVIYLFEILCAERWKSPRFF
jgi:hypothetical protein